jgi:hypothetical protein
MVGAQSAPALPQRAEWHDRKTRVNEYQGESVVRSVHKIPALG